MPTIWIPSAVLLSTVRRCPIPTAMGALAIHAARFGMARMAEHPVTSGDPEDTLVEAVAAIVRAHHDAMTVEQVAVCRMLARLVYRGDL